MPKQTRRFGAYHRANKSHQPLLGRMFPPSEIDPLMIEFLASEKSEVSGDKSGVSEESGVKGDKSGESASMFVNGKDIFSTGACGKVCGKLPFRRYKFLTILDF